LENLDAFKKQGIEILQRGIFRDARYYFLDTERILKLVYEIVYRPSNIPPEKCYPAEEGDL
jgi:hypothetical protein